MCLNEGCLEIFATRDELEVHTSRNHSDHSVEEPFSTMICSKITVAAQDGEPGLRDKEKTTSLVVVDSNLGYQSPRKSKQPNTNMATVTTSTSSPPSSCLPLFSTSICTIVRRGRFSGTAFLDDRQIEPEAPRPDRLIAEEVSEEPDTPRRKPLTLNAVSPRKNVKAGIGIVPNEESKSYDSTSDVRKKCVVNRTRGEGDINLNVVAKRKRRKMIAEMSKSGSEYSDSESCGDYSGCESEDKSTIRKSKSMDGTDFVCPVSTCGRTFSKVRVCLLSSFRSSELSYILCSLNGTFSLWDLID